MVKGRLHPSSYAEEKECDRLSQIPTYMGGGVSDIIESGDPPHRSQFSETYTHSHTHTFTFSSSNMDKLVRPLATLVVHSQCNLFHKEADDYLKNITFSRRLCLNFVPQGIVDTLY